MFHSGDGGVWVSAVVVPVGGFGGHPLVVTAIDAAAHKDDALKLAEGFRILSDGGLNVEQRADSDEGDLSRMGANLAEQERNCRIVGALRRLAGVGGLCEVGWLAGNAGKNRNIGATDCGQIAVDEAGAEFRVSKRGLDAEQVQFRTAQDKGQREGVVDVVANVGIENDELRGRRWYACRGLRAQKLAGDKRCQRDERCH